MTAIASPSAPPQPQRSAVLYRAPLRCLKRGDTGTDVRALQLFLSGAGLSAGAADGEFTFMTESALRAWQGVVGVLPVGFVDQGTWGALISRGFVALSEPLALEYPEAPDWMQPLADSKACHRRWGRIEYRSTNELDFPERVTILNEFKEQCIVEAHCPITGQIISLHGDVMPHYLNALNAIHAAGFSPLILGLGESFSPRFQIGSRTTLSRHAWGAAIDINPDQNRLAARPARPGQHGSLYDLVPIMNKHGFWWGGHARDPRKDGAHFEHVG